MSVFRQYGFMGLQFPNGAPNSLNYEYGVLQRLVAHLNPKPS